MSIRIPCLSSTLQTLVNMPSFYIIIRFRIFSSSKIHTIDHTGLGRVFAWIKRSVVPSKDVSFCTNLSSQSSVVSSQTGHAQSYLPMSAVGEFRMNMSFLDCVYFFQYSRSYFPYLILHWLGPCIFQSKATGLNERVTLASAMAVF